MLRHDRFKDISSNTHMKALMIRGLNDDELGFSKQVHKNINVRQTCMKQLVLTAQHSFKPMRVNCLNVVKAGVESSPW